VIKAIGKYLERLLGMQIIPRRTFLKWVTSIAGLATLKSGRDGTALVRAVAAAAAEGGGTVEIPHGRWTLPGPLVLPKNITLWGHGTAVSVIIANHAGNGIESMVSTTLRNFGVTTSVPANHGAAISNVYGTFRAESVATNGFALGLQLKQTEIFDISNCIFESASRANIWVVNKAGETKGKGSLANCISITNCQFKILPDAVGLIDNGSTPYSIRECSFKGGMNHMVFSGALPISIHDCEMEGAIGNNVVWVAARA
jgi:hypothetical protein